MLEEPEKMVGKVKSVENDVKSSLGLVGYEDTSKFEDLDSIPLPQCPLNNAQLCTHPSFDPQWHAPVPQHHPQPPQIYQGISKFQFYLRLEFVRRRKKKNNFTPIGESYASLFQRLRHRGMITPLLGYTPDLYSRNFDPSIRCAYHSDVQGHSIEDYRALKGEIEKIIQDRSIMGQNINSEESSSRADMQTSG
ncbi:hypothetical protein P3S67_030142 [Capsicum chacoense]